MNGIPAGALPAITPTLDDPQAAEIRAQLDARALWLSIPAALQPHYRVWRLRDLPRHIRVGSIPLLALVLVLTLVSNRFFSGELDPRDTALWTAGSLSVCFTIGLGVALAQFAAVQRYYEWLAGTLGALVLAKFVAMPQLLTNADAAGAESHFCMITVTVVTLALRLSWRVSVIVCAMGGTLGLLIAAQWAPDGTDWRSFSYYFLSISLVCLFIGWLFEEQEKTNFLQALLILNASREKETLNLELTRLAHQDALSGLPNRREFDRRLAAEWERLKREQKPLTVLFIDIDHFKAYNDHYGHATGDIALTAVSQAIARALLRPADLAARYGGEEFVVLLPDTDDSGAEDVAERIMAAINRLAIPHAASTTAHHVTASIGIATGMPAMIDSPLMLLESADTALYAAKQGGRWQMRVAPALA